MDNTIDTIVDDLVCPEVPLSEEEQRIYDDCIYNMFLAKLYGQMSFDFTFPSND